MSLKLNCSEMYCGTSGWTKEGTDMPKGCFCTSTSALSSSRPCLTNIIIYISFMLKNLKCEDKFSKQKETQLSTLTVTHLLPTPTKKNICLLEMKRAFMNSLLKIKTKDESQNRLKWAWKSNTQLTSKAEAWTAVQLKHPKNRIEQNRIGFYCHCTTCGFKYIFL